YGHSRIYHQAMQEAETQAKKENLGIWNPATNAHSEKRDYPLLLPWWKRRGEDIAHYRQQGIQQGILSVRLHYDEIQKAAENQEEITLLIDLQKGIERWLHDQALIFSGSKFHRLSVWIPDIYQPQAQEVIRLIKERYAEYGRGYAYIRGKTKMYKGRPELILTSVEQIRDVC
ncbi:MAG: thermonuclease family protein, partial [Bacteroidota bacterium]